MDRPSCSKTNVRSTIGPFKCVDPRAFHKNVSVISRDSDKDWRCVTASGMQPLWVHKSTLFRLDQWDDKKHGLFQLKCFTDYRGQTYVAATLVPGWLPPEESFNACFVLDKEPGPKQLKPFKDVLRGYGDEYMRVSGDYFKNDGAYNWFQVRGCRYVDENGLPPEAVHFFRSRAALDDNEPAAFPLK